MLCNFEEKNSSEVLGKTSLVTQQLIKEMTANSNKMVNMRKREEKEIPKQLTFKITKYLLDRGFYPHFKGFIYLKDSIQFSIQNKYIVFPEIKDLYSKLSERYFTKEANIERTIRYAISKTKYAYMTPKEFIARAVIDICG